MPRKPAEPNAPKPEKTPKKPEFSPTKIKTFLACRMMYRLDYVEKVGKFYHKSRAGFSFGSTLHQALQTFHEAGGSAAVSAPQLIETMEAGWQSGGYRDAAHEREHREAAVKILETYHAEATVRADTTRTFLTEKMLKWDMGLFLLTGRIDRVDEHLGDGSLEIVDYKSGRMGVTSDDVKSALAMSVYQLLVKKHWPERRVFATIHALSGGVTASAEYSENELTALEDDLRGIGLLILETDFDSVQPEPIPQECPFCDFLPLCSRHWRREGRDFAAELALSA